MESAPAPPEGPESGPPPGGDPPPLNHGILAILWIVVSLPAVFLLAYDRTWLAAPPGWDRLRALKIEQWVAVGILLIQIYFFLRAHLERTVRQADQEAARESPKKEP